MNHEKETDLELLFEKVCAAISEIKESNERFGRIQCPCCGKEDFAEFSVASNGHVRMRHKECEFFMAM